MPRTTASGWVAFPSMRRRNIRRGRGRTMAPVTVRGPSRLSRFAIKKILPTRECRQHGWVDSAFGDIRQCPVEKCYPFVGFLLREQQGRRKFEHVGFHTDIVEHQSEFETAINR